MYFSVIEHLPQELRDRFTEMREMDLSVQSKFRCIVGGLQSIQQIKNEHVFLVFLVSHRVNF